MNVAFSILFTILILYYIFRIIRLWMAMFKHYRYLRTKYPVSIWKLPMQNIALIKDEKDRTDTTRLYKKYIFNVIGGLIILIAIAAIYINFFEK